MNLDEIIERLALEEYERLKNEGKIVKIRDIMGEG